ncbi:non-ribosomal peptide synthetase [Streptomyces sp. NPDC020298]|uniref:non-ribosomal peptide synthetase n=1 Tax=unclassified Streptomyces TaxID=2593676 RepID=UPI0033D949A6
MPHRALDNLVAWQNRRASGAVGGATLQYAPLSFDVSFQEIFSTLCSGGTLHLVSEEQRHDMPGLLRLLDEQGVERVFMPYVALQQLAEASDALGLVPRGLRVLVSSGEQLRVTGEIRRLCRRLPGAVLENQYGPTESHVVTSFTLTGDPEWFPALPPIGTAIEGATVRVLDSRLRPVPVGAPGEIHIAGVALADGYVNSPALTAERFVQGPSGTRLYRTGDLGHLLPSGDIVCTGRADTQVKVRGFRVEPAEVELALMGLGLPCLRETAVVVRHRGADAHLAAFLVGAGDGCARPDAREVRERLRLVLPEHLVPSHLTWLDALPRTPSGKRDDAALRRLPLDSSASASGTAPRDALERDLAGLAAELLGVPELGVHDSIFDAGGTSLTAMRLMVLIEQRHGVAVPLSDFVAAPTIAGLARRLRAADDEPGFDPLVLLRPGGARPPVYFVHPMGGNVLCYLPLARQLPEDQPFYALQAPGAALGTEPLASIPELARTYVEAVRRAQPHGPYTVGGWSFGGFVAFEMARQLRVAGEEIAHLVLLDTVALNPDAPRDVNDGTLLTFFFWELLWLDGGSDTPVEAVSREVRTEEQVFRRIAELATRNGVLPEGSSPDAVRRLYRVFQANYQALVDHRPEVLDQDLTLLHATGSLPEVLKPLHGAVGSMYHDPTNGWGALTTGRIDIVDVPGDHLQVVEEPYVKHVAERLAALTGPDQEQGS